MHIKKLVIGSKRVSYVCFVLIYPVLIFCALKNGAAPVTMALLLSLIVAVSFFCKRQLLPTLGGIALIVLTLLFKDAVFAKLYPVLINSVFFILFVSSLKGKPLAQLFAEKIEPNLSEEKKIYTRKVTIAWSLFLLFNLTLSFLTLFASDEVWVLYNGFVSYILMGLMFASEYFIRRRCF